MPNLYPIAIVEDRWEGRFSGGAWLAIARADRGDYPLTTGWASRVSWAIHRHGPSGAEDEAKAFWASPPDWIAAGRTPDEARAALVDKYEKLARARAT